MKTALQTMIDSIPDKATRDKLTDIVNAKITKVIKCQSKTCKNAIVGFVDNKNRITANEQGKHKIRRHRPRLDGQYGFLCSCGNDSSIAEQEKVISWDKNPTREDLEKVAKNLLNNPTDYKAENGLIAVDGFTIEEIDHA